MMHAKLGVEFFSISELLYPSLKVRLPVIRARPITYMSSDNPNVGLAIIDCSLDTRRIVLKDDSHKKQMLTHSALELNCLETLAKTFIIRARQNQFNNENIFNNAPVRRISIAMNINSAFTGSYTEIPLWYQEFHLGQVRILTGSQPNVDFDAADHCL